MLTAFIVYSVLMTLEALYFFTRWRSAEAALASRRDATVTKLDAEREALLDRLLVKHGQTPLSEPVSTPKTLEPALPMTLYKQRLAEGALEDEQEARRFRTIPLSDEEKAELAEEARRRA